jgi:quercetin dioxygenase-like cupin family protein
MKQIEQSNKAAMMRPLQTKPYMLNTKEGQCLESLGALVSVKASWEQSAGAFNLFEVTCPPGYTTSLHIHYAEDVAVYVLEGVLTFFWGSEKKAAVTGSYFYQPRGIPHGFRVEGSTPARIIYLTFPAGLDRFVVEQEQLAPNAEPGTAAAHYQIEVLGPLPE